jgi:hypothetical protein
MPGKVIGLKKAKYVLLAVMVFCSVQFAIRDAGSCSAPVFRYALERWKPDPYKGVFIHRGPLSDQDQELLQQLEAVSLDAEYPLNLLVREVDVDTFSQERVEELLTGPIPEKLPVLAIWYPDQMGKAAPLWTLKLTPAVVKDLTRSPKRMQLAESLIKGESVVWVFVPSGNSGKDRRARELIQRELDLALETLAKTPYFVLFGAGQKTLSYGFPMLTVSRTDPEERFFLDQLLNSESDLHEYEDEPMVFPVFGRGRVLGCLFGEYITKKNIQGAVTFLAASCSCEVKSLNPGMDLLVAALWDRVVLGDLFVEDEDEPLPELTGVMPEAPSSAEETVEATAVDAKTLDATAVRTAETLPASPENSAEGSSLFKIYGITLGSVALVVVFASLILSHRRKEN